MATIGIFDSGVGGLSVLRQMRTLLPRERYVYYADSANCPYGDRSRDFILSRSEYITDFLIGKGSSVVVVACNTATGAAISELRARYDIPFIGMEPAVKPAALGTGTGVIGVLATSGTLKASKYLDTRDRWSEGVKIEETTGAGFVELVESLILDGPQAEDVVGRSLNPLLDAGADRIVLGCTHYPFLLPIMKKIADKRGREVRFVDPAPAIARHLRDVLLDNNLGLEDAHPGVELFSSGDDTILKKLYSQC